MLYNTENPHGGDVYDGGVDLDFSANTNPFGTPMSVKAAIFSCLDGLHRYPDPYCRKLVSAIAEHEGVPKDYILCGNGAAELIYSYCEALAPATALELAPTFSEYSLALERCGCRVFRHYLSCEDGFRVTEKLLMDIERLRPDALFLCDPNNPTGRLMDADLKLRLFDICARLGIKVFADECFMDFTDGKSCVSQTALSPVLTVLKAFTKSFGMAGVRLGYLISADAELLEKVSLTVQPWNVSTVAQCAGAAALDETDFVEKTKALIEKERPRMAEALSELGLCVFPSNANFLLVRGHEALGAMLRERRIAIRDCSNYFGLSKGYYRIAIKLPEENDLLIKTVKECMLWQKI